MKCMCIECAIDRNDENIPPDEKLEKTAGHDLWDADPNCDHDVKSASGGGVKCTKCAGWFCY